VYVHPQTRNARARIATVALILAAACALVALSTATPPASAGTGSPAASAAAKRCAAGKVRVRRPGRGSVCAKPCPAGTKRKVSRKGRLSCVKKKSGTTAPQSPSAPTGGGAPPPPQGGGTPPPNDGGSPPPPPASNGPAQGDYNGQTEQSRPVTFKVVGGEVQTFEAGVNTWCNTMYNNRVNFDAIANVPPMAIGPDGSFSYKGDENNGNIDIKGQITGNTATGTVGMNRGDTNYSGGQMYYGSCSASDVKWSATAG
jgi:hypothetical protein